MARRYLVLLWMLELGRLELYPPRLRHSSFEFRHSRPHRITPLENLNLGRDSNCTIYAIYFHFSGVGRGSARKNSLKIRIAPWILGINGVSKNAAGSKSADLQGNCEIFENEKMRAEAEFNHGWTRPVNPIQNTHK